MSSTQIPTHNPMPALNTPHVSVNDSDEFDFSRMLLRGKWIIAFGVACGLGIAYWAFIRTTPVYKSSVKILLSQLGESHTGIQALDSKSDYRHDLTKQIVLIRSPEIIQRSVDDNNLSELESFSGTSDPLRALLKGLKIRQEMSSDDSHGPVSRDVLTISFEGTEADDCPKVVDAVVESYAKFLEESHEDFSDEIHRLLHKTQNELLVQLSEKEAEYQKFRTETPEIWLADGKTNVFRALLQGIELQKSELFLERTALMAEASALDKSLKIGGNREALRLMVSGLAEKKAKLSEETGISVVGTLFPMLLEEQLLLDTLGPDHPKVASLHRRIELTRNHLTSQGLDLGTNITPGKKKDFITIYLESLNQQIKLTELKEAELNNQLEKQRVEVKKTVAFENKDAAMKMEIERIRALFDTVVARLGEVSLVKNVGQFKMHVVTPAGIGKQVAPVFIRMMTIGGLLGLLAGVGLAFLREYSDNRFTAPGDIHHHLGVPVIGHVPNMEKQKHKTIDSKIDKRVCTFYNPKSKYAEAMRAVRTALYFSTQNASHQVLQVTSPHSGDGKTTVSVNLAVSIACSGKQVLLIDADLRKPSLHKLLNLNNDAGLATTILEGTLGEPLAYVQQTEVPNLWCLPTGGHPSNPAELLTSSIFEQFLEIAHEKFDYVIVDTPPLLAVTDPSTVSARVDGVILVLRINKDTRATALRATDMLAAVGANLLGVVVNGAGQFESFGYKPGVDAYAAYGYGYGYGEDYEEYTKSQTGNNGLDSGTIPVMYDSEKHPEIPVTSSKPEET